MAEGGGGVLRELLAVFGFGVETEGLKKGENALEQFGEKVKHIAEGIAAVFAVKEIAEFAEANVKAMTQIERSATQLGISTDKVQEFQFASRSLGLEAGDLLNMMGRLQVAQQGAASGSHQAATAFGAMGVKLKDSNGTFKSADELFLDVAEGISKTHDASKQAAIATQLFGRQGRTLLPFLKEGRKGAEELSEQFRELGGGYTEDAIKEAAKYEKQSARLDLAFTGLKNRIMQALFPVLQWLSVKTMQLVKGFTDLTKGSNVLQAAMVVLGTIAAFFAAKMLLAAAPVLLMAAAIAALILVVDDIITLFSGGQSVIGDAIDKLYGKGAHLEFVQGLRDTWKQIVTTFHEAWDAFKPLYDALKWLAANAIVPAIKKTFGALRKASEYIGDAAGKDVLTEAELDYTAKHPNAPSSRAFLDATSQSNLLLANPAGLLPGGASNNVSVVVNTPPGLNEHQVGEHVAKQVNEVLKQQTRAAAATFQRSSAR